MKVEHHKTMEKKDKYTPELSQMVCRNPPSYFWDIGAPTVHKLEHICPSL